MQEEYQNVDLNRMRKATHELGRPQDAYESIIVSGTNGKGSTSNFIAKILQNAGYKVGLYNESLVQTLNHNLTVNSIPITDDELQQVGEYLETNLDNPISEYEFMMCTAFEYFNRQNVDVMVTEVAVGGANDATNVLDNTTSVITNIGDDHSNVLGESRKKKAQHIMATIKQDSSVFTNTDEEMTQVAKDIVEQEGATLNTMNEHISLERDEVLLDCIYDGERIKTALTGRYQEDNLNLAITATLNNPNYSVNTQEIKNTLDGIYYEARSECISDDPITILDGAHNKHAIESLVTSLNEIDKETIVVFGCLQTKLWKDMVSLLEPVTEQFIFTEAEKSPEDPPVSVQNLAQYTEVPSIEEKDPTTAIQAAEKLVEDNQIIMVTGSLYVIKLIRTKHFSQT